MLMISIIIIIIFNIIANEISIMICITIIVIIVITMNIVKGASKWETSHAEQQDCEASAKPQGTKHPCGTPNNAAEKEVRTYLSVDKQRMCKPQHVISTKG